MLDVLALALREEAVSVNFQPLFDSQRGSVFAYEAFSRGPYGSSIYAPHDLFREAAALGLLEPLQRLVVSSAIKAFVDLNLKGSLFISLDLDSGGKDLFDCLKSGVDVLRQHGGDVVVKLKLADVKKNNSRDAGLLSSLADAGAGVAIATSSLEDIPDESMLFCSDCYIKLDKYAVEDISSNQSKFGYLRGLVAELKAKGWGVVAEGVETHTDYASLLNIGVGYFQGYLFGRPSRAALYFSEKSNSAVEAYSAFFGENITAYDFVSSRFYVSESLTNHNAIGVLVNRRSNSPVPLVDSKNVPVGFIDPINALRWLRGENPAIRSAGRKCIAMAKPLRYVFDQKVSLGEMLGKLSDSAGFNSDEIFVVTKEGRYVGYGLVSAVFKTVAEIKVNQARLSNPLTLLPGNIEIERRINFLLKNEVSFVAIYWDLDNFKPYNDHFGYSTGDELILLISKVLKDVFVGSSDFVGHIGGDDFITITSSSDWERMVQDVIALFASHSVILFKKIGVGEEGIQSQDRQGNLIYYPLSSLSGGVVSVAPNEYDSAAKVSMALGEAKQQAKKMPGNSYFVERRRPVELTSQV
ncbi:GGDEF domain-containing protein [Uliginosibacterium sediminicola]|uniref:GGDEF domain-containing protein n=1 Tax=Uliginosibacterium sediminicola TaxID=2024550 RepID=A0ABU9YZN0_9RHOO